MEEIICFVDLMDQKSLIWNGVCSAKCSQGERFSSLSLSKTEWTGALSCKHGRNRNGIHLSWSVKNSLPVAAEKNMTAGESIAQTRT